MKQRINPNANKALDWLDRLLHCEMMRIRARYDLSMDEFRGLYISDEQVDALVQERVECHGESSSVRAVSLEAGKLEQAAWQALRDDPHWNDVTGNLALNLVEQAVLLLLWAPHLNPCYETIYAYLNNDVTKKRPSVDLITRIFRSVAAREIYAAVQRPDRLFRMLEDNGQRGATGGASILQKPIKLCPLVAEYLIGMDPWASHAWVTSASFRLPADPDPPASVSDSLASIARLVRHDSAPSTIVIDGAPGSGRRRAAEYIARFSGKKLVCAQASGLLRSTAPSANLLNDVAVGARITGALIFVEEFPCDDSRTAGEMTAALRQLCAGGARVVVPTPPGFCWSAKLGAIDAISLSIPRPNATFRQQLWKQALNGSGDKLDTSGVADQFDLTPGQIGRAGRWVSHSRALRGDLDRVGGSEILQQAARLQSLGSLEDLAHTIRTPFCFDDLILPPATLRRIREIVDAMHNRRKVFDQWGLAKRIGGPTGIVVMFSGASGTGKTMSAGIIARELGMDIYCINLASVVSKYIGETEKNLEKIFDAARNANCVLFFDEAEALFGKRSEVKDAHDRYANIETAYLLQRIESHNGLVILATNIAKNIDSGFSRRIHYTIDFPRPDESLRNRLWHRMFPDEAPLAEDVDFPFVARQFEFTGGEIRNTAREAALLAASRDSDIDMSCVVQALAKQLHIRGRPPAARDFKQYAHMLDVKSSEPTNISGQIQANTGVTYGH